MSDDEDAQIVKKLEELQNLPLAQEGLVVSSDFKSILTKVQELQHALFERQHRDAQKINESVNELRKSSKRIENMTHWLILLTIALGIITALDVVKLLG
jgi:sigma54-dependent transcription regulator